MCARRPWRAAAAVQPAAIPVEDGDHRRRRLDDRLEVDGHPLPRNPGPKEGVDAGLGRLAPPVRRATSIWKLGYSAFDQGGVTLLARA